MITGLNLDETEDYILKSDTENPTVWKLGIISTYIHSRIMNENENPLEGSFRVLQIAIKGWENFTIPYETEKQKICGREMDVIPLSVLERIPMTALTELYERILAINSLTETERKNS